MNTTSRYGCFNKADHKPTYMAQLGWNLDNTRNMVSVPDEMSRECKYDRTDKDPKCAGCLRAKSA